MNKSFLYYVIALLLSFCTNSFGFTKYVTNNLNLRYEANAHSYVLTVIPKGTAVTIDEDCNCSWVLVEYNGYVGYVSTKYLSKNPVSHKLKPNISRRKITFYNPTNSRVLSNRVRYYTNRYGNRVQSPTIYNSKPAGATALCRDGTYSFSQNRRGTCSHHGGVAIWY
jgi:uncharacterized protein YgiM (DUF1202 family)